MNDFFAGQVFNAYEYFGHIKNQDVLFSEHLLPMPQTYVYSEASITGRKNL